MPAKTKRPKISSKRKKRNILAPIFGPELVLALVGAVGTELKMVAGILEQELLAVNYRAKHIRISELMHKLDPKLPVGGPEDIRYDKHMTAGTEIRKKLQRGDALALLTIGAVRQARQELTGNIRKPAERYAYLIRSLKHPAEVATLRKIYGRGFFLIAAHSSREARKQKLARDIAESRFESNADQFLAGAEELIVRDEEESGTKFGQQVRETFHLADVFVDGRDRANATKDVRRFVEILFGHPFHTPNVDELAMFHARAAALRSADLSRQVGAVITDHVGAILSTGCNEVPRAGGGAYWAGDPADARDWQRGFDPSAQIKQRMLEEVLDRLGKSGWLNRKKRGSDARRLVEDALYDQTNPLLRGARLMDLLEFGRIVHAEMSAISEAVRRGVQIQGATLYCTTFPCHMCARHIIATGIAAVRYIEPYPKSMALNLYPDSVCLEDGEAGKVQFKAFSGIAPNRFMELFAMPIRKTADGTAVKWEPTKAMPRLERFVLSYLLIESRVSKDFLHLLRSSGVIKTKRSNQKLEG